MTVLKSVIARVEWFLECRIEAQALRMILVNLG
jgi:hypothetical protein